MKILGGSLRNRTLKTPKGGVTRPTTSMVRKALFDICQGLVEDALVLDLFSGSGALGIEALSRGAQHATFIERDREAQQVIRENLKNLNLETQATLLVGDVFSLIKRCKHPFHLITADPPYKQKTHEELLQFIDREPLLAPGGRLFIEAPFPSSFTPPLEHLQLLSSRRYGTTVLHEWTTLLK